MSRATFPAAARLHRPTEYAAALSGRRVARGAYFIVTAHHAVATDVQPLTPPQARLGLVMAKRPETRAKRITELVELAEQRLKPKQFR